MIIEEIILNEQRNVKLKAIIQNIEGDYGWNITTRPSILILPGGGYSVCSDKEAEPVAAAFLRAGFNAFILRYTVKSKGAWDYPLQDYEQAMELISARSGEWHVSTDKLAVVGFSAGGHLAAYAATFAKHKPAAAILGYAALSGRVCDEILPDKKVKHPAELVDDNTCPCFLFAARDDSVVDISNTLNFENALHKHGIMFESHIYSYGNHGFSTADSIINNFCMTPRAKNWVDDAIGFLNEYFGEFTYFGYRKPKFGRTVNGDNEEYLSSQCTLGYISRQPEPVQTLLTSVYDKFQQILVKRGFTSAKAIDIIGRQFKLCDILDMIDLDEREKQRLDDELRKIKNKKEK